MLVKHARAFEKHNIVSQKDLIVCGLKINEDMLEKHMKIEEPGDRIKIVLWLMKKCAKSLRIPRRFQMRIGNLVHIIIIIISKILLRLS